MQIEIITIFPEMFNSFLNTSLIARAISKKIIKINIHDLRLFTTDNHRTVDGKPYGGGPGMVLRVDIVAKALNEVIINSNISRKKTKIILLTPQGKGFDQTLSRSLATNSRLIFICGHFEGFDERIRDLVDLEISIGDYILTGGEIPAMVLTDSIVRNIKGFLGKENSIEEESFSYKPDIVSQKSAILEYPQYTRPEKFKNKKVPEVLLSGNHLKIQNWRQENALIKTNKNRPDLLTLL